MEHMNVVERRAHIFWTWAQLNVAVRETAEAFKQFAAALQKYQEAE